MAHQALKACCSHLSKDSIPHVDDYRRGVGISKALVDRGMVALNTLAGTIDTKSLHESETVAFLLGKLPGIIAWMSFAVQDVLSQPAYLARKNHTRIIEGYSKSLHALIEGSESIRAELLRSAAMMVLLAELWVYVDPSTRKVVLPTRDTDSHLIHLFGSFMDPANTSNDFLDILESSSDAFLEEFSQATVIRVHHVTQGFDGATFIQEMVLRPCFKLIFHSTLRLARSKQLRRHLMRLKHIEYCCKGLFVAAYPISSYNTSVLPMELARELMESAVAFPRGAVEGISQLVDGRILFLMVEGLVYSQDKSFDIIAPTLQKFMSHATFRSVALKLQLSMHTSMHMPITSKSDTLLQNQNTKVRDLWQGFLDTSTMLGHAARSVTECPSICDHLLHSELAPKEVLEDPTFRSQQCTGCQSFLYCSRECQKQDWQELHRLECPSERTKRIRDKRSGIVLKVSTRKMLLSILNLNFNTISRDANMINSTNSVLKSICGPAAQLNNCVFTVDMRECPPHRKFVTVTHYLTTIDSAHLIRRVQKMVDVAGENDGHAFVELVTAFGPCRVRTFGMLAQPCRARKANKSYELLSGVSWVEES
ncbi:hypothetical protein FA15DRAFT_669360 [Coprinopsis marcescibilis]|uniref:MYND-type domain-containing protein n=1 Tax=Coprinopsis marcescibilis TaxID=230819 RepID=A0A5C3KVR1_COPMA|nr:hypothetical protein FA15DRAFT_669360 [Coprinopsis marcescibilis]